MSLSKWELQALGSIEEGLLGSDPELASLLAMFRRLASGEEMPTREKIWAPRRHRPRCNRRLSREDGGRHFAHVRYLRPSGRQAMPLLLWLAVALTLVAVTLVLNRNGCSGPCPQLRGIAGAASSPRPTPHKTAVGQVLRATEAIVWPTPRDR